MSSTRTLVLLSGGLDSTAALLWAWQQWLDVEAMFVYYGQPAANRECERAIKATRELNLQFHRLDLASAYYGGSARGLFLPKPAGIEGGVDRAFVPCRNPLLLTAAAARAQMMWPVEQVRLVAGFNASDAAGFPDCRPDFLRAFSAALNLGLGEERVSIETPWVNMRKSDVVRWARTNASAHMPLVDGSWSCYREMGPCGECTACVTRKAAYAEADGPSDRT